MAQKDLKRMLSKLGIASRTEAEKMILAGRISVNGVVVKNPILSTNSSDRILVDNKEIQDKKLGIYALNKPRGVVTTMAVEEKRPKVADLMPKHQYLFPVGRLDKASRGLLLLTNDNDFADRLLSSKSKIAKVYRVQIKGKFREEDLAKVKNGIEIGGIKYTVEDIQLDKSNKRTAWLEIVLNEGKNREIRKILKYLGYEILDLIRVQIGELKLADLKIAAGKYVQIDKNMIV